MKDPRIFSKEGSSFIQRVRDIAAVQPSKNALVYYPISGAREQVTWDELYQGAVVRCEHLKTQGIRKGDCIAIDMNNRPSHLVWILAISMIDACHLSLPQAMTEAERNGIIAEAAPRAIVTEGEQGLASCTFVVDIRDEPTSASDRSLRNGEPTVRRRMLSGGTMGIPKVVECAQPMLFFSKYMEFWEMISGQEEGDSQLITGPLFHGAPASSAIMGMFGAQTLYLTERFDAKLALELIDTQQINCISLVPTTMQRLLDDPLCARTNFSSITSLYHTGGRCFPELKCAWIDLLGGKRVYEVYSMVETIGMTAIRGDEWLDHQESVGKGIGCDIEIRSNGEKLEPYHVGEIYMRKNELWDAWLSTSRERSASPADFKTVGDIGYVDGEGYLYYLDRRSDVVVSGGTNIYVSEIEAALKRNAKIADAAVIGKPDHDWGRKLCAYVVPKENSELTEDEVKHWLRRSLAHYKVPKEITFLNELPYSQTGKLLRRDLAN